MNLKTFNHVKIPELNFELNAVTTEGGRRYTTPQGNILKWDRSVRSTTRECYPMPIRQRDYVSTSIGEPQAKVHYKELANLIVDADITLA